MHHFIKITSLISLSAFILSACGNNDNPKTNNDGIIITDDFGADLSDMSSDMADISEDMEDMPKDMDDTGPVAEVEPNDTPFQATKFTIERGFKGQIAEFKAGDANFDQDNFRFVGNKGTVLTLDMEVGPGFYKNRKIGLIAELKYEAQGVTLKNLALTNNVRSRSFYLPFNGEYTIRIQQFETHPDVGQRPPHGGDDANYTVKTTMTPSQANHEPLAWDKLHRRSEADGERMPAFYPFTITERGEIEIYIRYNEALNQLGSISTGIWDVKKQDYADLFPKNEPREGDAFVSHYKGVIEPGEYLLILDCYLNPVRWDYEILFRKVEGSANLPIVLANGESYEGFIGEPFDWKGRVDRDIFRVTVEPYKHTQITATNRTDKMQSRLMVFDEVTGKAYHHAFPSEDSATMTIYNPFSQPRDYRVIVDHHDNLIPVDPVMPQGGELYQYRIERTDYNPPRTTLTGQRRTVTVPLAAGQFSGFEVHSVEGHLWTIDVNKTGLDWAIWQNFESNTGYRLDYVSSAWAPMAPQPTMAYQADKTQRVHVDFYEHAWIDRADNDMIQIDFRSVDMQNVTYAEVPITDTRLTPETAISLDVTSPVSVKGSLVSMASTPGAEFYSVTLLQGETISLVTEADAAQSPTNTSLVITDANNTLLQSQEGVMSSASVVDYIYWIGLGYRSGYAASLFEAPADGTYLIEVRARQDKMLKYVDGGYQLKLAKVNIPAPN